MIKYYRGIYDRNLYWRVDEDDKVTVLNSAGLLGKGIVSASALAERWPRVEQFEVPQALWPVEQFETQYRGIPIPEDLQGGADLYSRYVRREAWIRGVDAALPKDPIYRYLGYFRNKTGLPSPVWRVEGYDDPEVRTPNTEWRPAASTAQDLYEAPDRYPGEYRWITDLPPWAQ